MNENKHKPCYGKIFPDLRKRSRDGSAEGRVFSLVTVTPAGMFPARPQLRIDQKQWDNCVQCPEFDHCYKLGMATLAMQTAAER